MSTQRVDVVVTGDARSASGALSATDRELRNVQGSAAAADRSMGGIGGTLTKIGAGLLAAGGLRAGLRAVGESIELASGRIETLSKVDVVFGRNANAVKAWSRTSTASLTTTERAVLDTVAGFNILLGNKGVTGAQGLAMSKRLTELSTDLASFFNTDVSTAADAINSALKGEMDPIEQFGVSLNDAALKAKALELGLYSGKGALDPYAKSMAAYKLILEQTAKAQGDVERTQGSAANQMRMFTTNVDELKTSIGAAFTPLIERFGPGVNRFLEDLNTKITSGGFDTWMDAVGDAAEAAWAWFRKLGPEIAAAFDGVTVGDFKSTLEAAGGAAKTLAEFASSAMAAFNDLSPQTKENLLLIVAAGGAVGLASRNPVVKIGVDLVAGTVTTIATTIAASMASRLFSNTFAQRVVVTNWPAGAFTGGGAAGGRGGRITAAQLGSSVAIGLAGMALPWLVDKLPIRGALKDQVNAAASVASYGAMGFAMFGPLGGVGGAIYGGMKILASGNKTTYQELVRNVATSDYIKNTVIPPMQRDAAVVATKVNVLSGSSYTMAGQVSDLYKTRATNAQIVAEQVARNQQAAYLKTLTEKKASLADLSGESELRRNGDAYVKGVADGKASKGELGDESEFRRNGDASIRADLAEKYRRLNARIGSSDLLRPGYAPRAAAAAPAGAARSQEVPRSGEAPVYVTEEQVARALNRLLLGSAARNGQVVMLA